MKLKNLIASALCGFALSASAEMVEYWDPVGKVTNSVEATVVTKDTATLESGWYVVTGEVSRTTQINVTGTDEAPANLILADGAKLTVDLTRNDSRVDHLAALHVPTGKALSIWATRENGTGAIEAKGRYQGAGIGGQANDGSYVEACGTVSIYGGNVTAIGSEYAAGIGGGGRASKTGGTGGTISIYGGIVTANGENGGAAIGGGNRADGGVISIYGGEVIADNTKGDSEGAGIGGGYAGSGGMILIAGGKVTAVGGYKDNGGAGIGGGEKGSGGTIMITGGIVNATGTDYGAGIGGGDEGAGGDVTISGGTVVAKAGKSSVWDIGSGDTGGSSGEFVVTGGSVLLANSMKCRDGYPTNGDGTQVYCTMVPGFEANAAVKIEGLPNYGTNDIFADASGNVYLYLPMGDHSFTANGEARSVTVVNAAKVFATYWDPVSGTEKSALCVAVGDSTVLEDGNWYVVNGKVERGSVAVNGKANLILADGCELKANGYSAQAGIAVSEGNSLTIYAQAGGTGKLTANGAYYGAGIGGGQYCSCGTVTINGGVVTATGGDGGAGIGGGSSDYYRTQPRGNGGLVTINGGTVTANGGWHGAGIGGGSYSAGGQATITGGRLTVTSEDGDVKGDLIGAGAGGHSRGTVAISGGIFSWRPDDAWLVDLKKVMVCKNPDAKTSVSYPWAVLPLICVSFERPLEHMDIGIVYTSDGEPVADVILRETHFLIPKGTSGVKVVFTSKGCYEIDKTEYAFTGPINEDCTIPAEDLPTVKLVWPEGYKRVEYIGSTAGGGQYIDTGIKSSPTLRATMDYRAFEHTGRVNLGTFGADDADWRYFDYSGGPLFDCGSARAGSTPGNTLDLNVRYVVNVGTDEDDIYLTVTDAARQAEVKSFTAKRDGTPSAENVFVFGGCSGDSVVCTPMRLYSLTLRDFVDVGSRPFMSVTDFVPCVRTSDGTAGLYDLMGNRFVENAGEGSFVLEEDEPLAIVTVPRHEHVVAFWTSGDESETNRIEGSTFWVAKGAPFKVMFEPETGALALDGPSVYESDGVSGDVSLTDEQVPVALAAPVEYVDADGSIKSRAIGEYVFVTSATAEMSNGWYVLGWNVSRDAIVVKGNAHLILADGGELNAIASSSLAGITVEPGNSITIYGQTGGTGKLTATGGKYGAGIGGGYMSSGGDVTINGGIVIARGNGGEYGAGIGGGYAGDGCTVIINGGTVTAIGGLFSAGIGGGNGGAVGKVTINGGTVTATGGEDGAGIGGKHGVSVLDKVTLDLTKVEVVEGKIGNNSSHVKIVEKPLCEGGTIGFVNGVWVITPNTDAKTVTITKLQEEAKLAVKCGEYAVPSAAFVGFGEGKTEGVFSLALDEDGVVTIGEEEIPVRPTIGDLDEGEPFVVGEGSVEVTVKAIPGLKYTLKRTDSLRRAEGVAPYQDWGEVGEPVVATGATVTLTDEGPLPESQAFYVIDVSVP